MSNIPTESNPEDRIVVRARLSEDFGGPTGRVLDRFSIELHSGEIAVLLGPSGCGKTTVLRKLAEICGSTDAETGFVAPKRYGFAFQQPELIPWRTVEGNVRYEDELCGDEIENPRALLVNAGLELEATLFPDQLSVGMRQRTQLLRVVARDVPLALLDEPLSAVDQPQRLAIARNLRERFLAQGSAVFWVTHDLLEALTVADRILVVGGRPLRICEELRVRDEERPSGSASVRRSTSGNSVESLLGAVQDASMAGTNPPTAIESGTFNETPIQDEQSVPSLFRHSHSGVLSLAFAGIIIVCWEVVIRLVPKWNFFLPPPSEWVPRLVARVVSGELLRHFIVTFRECIFGLGLGFVVGTVAAYTAAQFYSLSRAVRPLLLGMTAVPLFVLAPAFIVWFGIDEKMKVALAACSSCPFVALVVLDAVQASRGTYHQYLHRNGVPGARLFVHYTLPYTMASWFVGLRAAGVAALLGAFLGEFVSAERGLGYIILLDAGRYRMADALGGVALLFLLAVGLDLFFRFLASFRHRLLFKLRL